MEDSPVRPGRKGIIGAFARAARRFRRWVKAKRSRCWCSCNCQLCALVLSDMQSLDMERSQSPPSFGRSPYSSSPGSGSGAPPRPAELGCVHVHHHLHGQQDPHMQPGRPGGGRTKMRKFDFDMLAGITMLKLRRDPSPSGRMFRGTWVSDQGLEVPVAIKVFHYLFSVEAEKRVSHKLKAKVVLRHRNLLCPLGTK